MDWYILEENTPGALASHPGAKADADGHFIAVQAHALVIQLRVGRPEEVPEQSLGRFKQRIGWYGESLRIRELSIPEVRRLLASPAAPAPPPVVVDRPVLVIPSLKVLERYPLGDLRELATRGGLDPGEADRMTLAGLLDDLRREMAVTPSPASERAPF